MGKVRGVSIVLSTPDLDGGKKKKKSTQLTNEKQINKLKKVAKSNPRLAQISFMPLATV